MTAVVALVERVLGLLLTVLGLLGVIQNNTRYASQEIQPFSTSADARSTAIAVNDGTIGLSAAHTERLAILSAIAALNAPVLAAIAALPAGSALSIPTDADNAAAVWATLYQTTGLAMIDLCARGGYWPWALSSAFTHPAYGSPGFQWEGNFVTPRTNPPPNVGGEQPQVDWSLWVPGDDLLTFLQVNEQYFTWVADVDGTPIADTGLPLGAGNTLQIRCIMRPELLNSATSRRLPPVWPGLANVVLGTPVALADGLVVSGPLHGVLIDCATAPPGASEWVLGAEHAFYRWGEVSFVTDNGESEPFQFLGFGLGVYLPRTMAIASSAILRVSRLPTATVTPFTIISA